MDALAQFHSIFTPVFAILLVSIYFALHVVLDEVPSSGPNTIFIPELSETEPDTLVYVIMMAATIVGFGLTMFCIYRCRTFCEQVFRKFLIVDILSIIALGFGFFFFVFLQRFGANMGWPTFVLLVWNFAFVGVWTFYHPVPALLHRFYIAVLNGLMAIFVTLTLREWVAVFIGLVAFADVAAMTRPRMTVIAPFLMPRHIQPVYATPRIFYDIDGLRLRASDFMMYGLLVGLASRTTLGMAMAAIAVLSAVCLCVFVFPFFSKNVRPLPFAFALVLLLELCHYQIVAPLVYEDLRWLHTFA